MPVRHRILLVLRRQFRVCKLNYILGSVSILVFILLAGCDSAQSPQSDSGTAVPASACTSAQAPVFTTVRAIFTNNCDNCHGHNFASFSNAASSKNSIYNLVQAGSMPQNASLSQADKDVILQWVACGAVN